MCKLLSHIKHRRNYNQIPPEARNASEKYLKSAEVSKMIEEFASLAELKEKVNAAGVLKSGSEW